MRNLFFVICLVVFSAGASANPVKVNCRDQGDNRFVISLNIAKGWKVYGPYSNKQLRPLSILPVGAHNLLDFDIHWPKAEDNMYEGVKDINFIAKPVYKEFPLIFNVAVDMVACNPDEGCIRVREKFDGSARNEWKTLLYMAFMAILGGFILNFMPCVLPVVAIKSYAIMKSANISHSSIRINALFNVMGTLVGFIALALVTISLKHAGEYLGWGFHFQEPKFVIFLVVVLFVSALLMHGDIAFSNNVASNNKLGNFLTGGLIAFLATPCTAPILTPVLGFCLTQSNYVTLIIYVMIGLGISMPFLLMFINPNISSFLPKPGKWMEKTRQFFSVLLLATVMWLLYILNDQLGMKPTLLVAGGLILLKFCLVNLSGWKKWGLSVIVCFFIFYLPYQMKINDAEQMNIVNDYWEPFSVENLDRYLKEGNVVLVDVTAQWCAICKVNKILVVDNIDLLERLKFQGVKLLKADITLPNKSVNNYLKLYNRSAIPFNIVYSGSLTNYIILPEILIPRYVEEAISKLKSEPKN